MALDLKESSEDEEFVKALFRKSNVDVLVIHRVDDAIAFNGVSYEKCDTFYARAKVTDRRRR
jgi:hypothetical protein